jgi:hypothetical protein
MRATDGNPTAANVQSCPDDLAMWRDTCVERLVGWCADFLVLAL